MPFELIMLLGFFGAGLLGMLPETVQERSEGDFRRRTAGASGRRQDAAGKSTRATRLTAVRKASPPRGASRAVA